MLGRPIRPSEAELRAALDHFRHVEPLCRFEASKGNEGFTAHLSFNISSFRQGRDGLEIALRRAVLRFSPKHPEKWGWADAIREWVARAIDPVSIKTASSETRTRGIVKTGRVEATAQGHLKLPLFGRIGGSTRVGVEGAHQNSAALGVSEERTRTRQAPFAEIHRPAADYELRLSAAPDDDLVRLNSELDRIGVLQATEPSVTEVEDVKVVLRLRAHDALEHSIRIREATGVWKAIVEPRAKKVLAELLFEKVLLPLHDPQVLWPKRPPE